MSNTTDLVNQLSLDPDGEPEYVIQPEQVFKFIPDQILETAVLKAKLEILTAGYQARVNSTIKKKARS